VSPRQQELLPGTSDSKADFFEKRLSVNHDALAQGGATAGATSWRSPGDWALSPRTSPWPSSAPSCSAWS